MAAAARARTGRPGGPRQWADKGAGFTLKDLELPGVAEEARPVGRLAWFLFALGRGMTRTRAAQIVQLPKSTLMAWLKRARGEEQGEFRDFLDQIEGAEVGGELRLVQLIQEATARDWKAARYLLSVRDPVRYAERTLGQLGSGEDEFMADRDFVSLATRSMKALEAELAIRFRQVHERMSPAGGDAPASKPKAKARSKAPKRASKKATAKKRSKRTTRR